VPAGPFAGARVATVATLAVLSAAAWAITGSRMRGMDATELGTLAFFTVSWVVMMAAMMFPSVAPFVAIYAGLQDDRRARGMSAPAGATSLLVAGYLAAWTAAGLAAYGLLIAGREIAGGRLAWDAGGRWVAVAVLAAAAAYEFTPLKDACLTRCRGPLAYMLSSWHDGRAGALRMGIGHGAWCIGCCWALMAALFALGVMSVTWMVVVALLIAAEKLLPWRRAATAGVAAALLVLAVGVAVYPA
jgi:predicted metal-binding membrane protein